MKAVDRIQSSFSHLFWFRATSQSDWLKKFAPLGHPIRSSTITNRDDLVRVFPRFVPATCLWLEV